VVVDVDMHVLGEGLAGPSNHLRVGLEPARLEVERAVLEALRNAKVSLLEIEYAYCGIAGSDHPQHRANVVDSLRTFFAKNQFTIDSDARVALTAGVGFGRGINIISGTGSVAFGRNDEGKEARSGGWGPTLGDEGSGYSIARRGLASVVRAADGRAPKTQLLELLCSHHGMCDATDLPYFVYSPSTHADDIAAYGRLVFEAAQNGDAVANEILQTEGVELGNAVVAVARALGMEKQSFPVSYAGGAFAGGELLIAPMRQTILASAPHAVIGPAIERAVLGAARMAIAAAQAPRPTRSVT
jgi:N-acetylglucosamine kinase-like BadF-type ATPase